LPDPQTQADQSAQKPAFDFSFIPGWARVTAEPPKPNPPAAPPRPDALPGSYTTALEPEDEKQFQSWVKQNNIPWRDAPKSDYDMRGFWQAQRAGDPDAKRAANLHFPDTYKTPYHKSFSNESKYATSAAPHWEGNKLIDNKGAVVFDEDAKPSTPAPTAPKKQALDFNSIPGHTEISSDLQARTQAQAKSELPRPTLAPPWEDEPKLPAGPPTTKLGKAYADAKSWLSEHEQHLSEKVLAPFRTGIDRMSEDLVQAGESGHTPTGGQLTGPTRALASGVGELLRQVPVGKDVKSTILANVIPPELGPEGKALSKEAKAAQKTEQWRPHDLGKEHNLSSEEGYAYHATNEERAREIAESGGMQTHKPWEHTEQNAWPDGSTEKRIYFTPKASSAWQFAPEDGKSVLLRVKQDAAKLKAEGTGDLYSQKPIHHKNVEILGDDKQWHRISDLTTPKAETKSALDFSSIPGHTVVSPAKTKPAPKTVEPAGIHEDDVPRGAKTPDVDWSDQDLQDSAKTVTAETIAKDYGPKRKGAKFSVYKSHIPMEDLPSAKIAEEEDAEFQDSDWRENYQGLIQSTTPPIKVRVNPKGDMEILDGNHRAQLWSEADMTHAPAWVIDERGKGIENLSEDEKAERAEAEEEQRQQAKTPTAKELPAQPRLPDSGTHAAIKTDDGSIYFDDAPEKQRTHIMLAKDLGIPPERVVSGGWLTDGEYEGSARSDAGKWGEQARAQARVAENRAVRSSESERTPKVLYHGTHSGVANSVREQGLNAGMLTDSPDLAREEAERATNRHNIQTGAKEKPVVFQVNAKPEEISDRGEITSATTGKSKGRYYDRTAVIPAERVKDYQPTKLSSQSELPSWEKLGKDFETVFHGGKTKVAEVDPSKLQQRDAGFFGKGFYVTSNEKFAKTYGGTVSKKTFNPDARILNVGTIHPQYEQKINPELQKEIEATQRSYYQSLPKAQKDPTLVDRYMEMVNPKNKAFDLGTWIESVNKYAEKNGYDAIRFSDGEIVVKNPKALAEGAPKQSLADRLFSEALAKTEPAPKQVFHGTTANVSDISQLKSEFSREGVAGRGIYLTETPEQAGAYAGPAESGTGGRVLAGSLSSKAKLLDGNAALPDALRNKLQKKVGRDIDGSPKTYMEFMSAVRSAGGDTASVQKMLADSGFHGVRYVGDYSGGQRKAIVLFENGKDLLSPAVPAKTAKK
jgi:hypothetical protein